MPSLTSGVVDSAAAPGRRIDPKSLTEAQRLGKACGSCDKRWPRPRNLFGQLPDGTPVLVCDDCATSPHLLDGDHA